MAKKFKEKESPIIRKPLPKSFNQNKGKDEDGNYILKENNISYKINTEDFYIVHKSYSKGKPFYMIPLKKRYYDQWIWGYKPIRFNRGVELEDKSIIKIISGFEDIDINYSVDKQNKYTLSIIVITKFELYETPEVLEKKALREYESQKTQNFDVHR